MPKNPNGGATTPPDPSISAEGASSASPPSEMRAAGRGSGPGGESRSSSGPGGSDTGDDGGSSRAASSAAGSSGSVSSAAGADTGSRDSGASPATGSGNASGRTVGGRKKQFVIAPRQPPEGIGALSYASFAPLQFSTLEQALRNSPDIDVIDTVGPKSVVGALADGMGGQQGVLVARMTDQKAATLHQQGQGRLLVERDQHLNLMEPALRQPGMVTGVMPSGPGSGPVLNAVISVLGKDGAPQADAEVSLFGSMLPASGSTDANGQVTLSLFGETADTVRGLYVKPKSDYWSFYQRDPDISSNEPNVVVLRALSDWPALAGFPRQRAYGWGQKAMRLDQLPGSYRGQGIKIAVIDSGVASTSHDNLRGVKAGFDVLNKKTNPDGWDQDTLGHGSHCAGVIAAADIASGIRGFAPDAEVHACKLFPGGQVSQLIDALEYCIDKQIDVVNLSMGGAEVSEALEQQILRAKRAGIACIVAAGNSGGAVQYPASSPNVLAVAAVGKLDEFPADSYHAQTLDTNVDAYGYFTAKFSCYGPQVAVCAPGVAITSCVPPNNFAAWDGTSMAAPHITGLAALVLAHHPDFQSQYKARGAERVERLFQIIRMSAHKVSLGDQSRIGYGLPDVLSAVGLQPQANLPAAKMAPQMAGMMMAPQMAGFGNQMPAQAMGSTLDPYGLDAARAAYAAFTQQPWYVHHSTGALPYSPIGAHGFGW